LGKPVLLLVFLLVLSATCSYAGEFGVSLGSLGFSYNYDSKNNAGFLSGRLLNVMYQSDAGLGVTISPFNFKVKFGNGDDYLLTFANISFNYNFFNYKREYLMLGPVVSVHTLDVRDPCFLEFRSGINFSLRNVRIFSFMKGDYKYDGRIYNDTTLNYDILVLECGYKYNKAEKHGFYTYVGIDLLAALMFF